MELQVGGFAWRKSTAPQVWLEASDRAADLSGRESAIRERHWFMSGPIAAGVWSGILYLLYLLYRIDIQNYILENMKGYSITFWDFPYTSCKSHFYPGTRYSK